MSTRPPLQHAEDDGSVGISGTKMKFIQPRHWVIHHPLFDEKPMAMIAYMRLRAAQFEGDDTVRVMNRAEIAEITGIKEQTLKRLLPLMDKNGLLVRTNKDRRNATPVWSFVDNPPEKYTGITDGIDLRKQVLSGVTRSDYKENLDKSGGLAGDPPERKQRANAANRDKVGGLLSPPGGLAGDPGGLSGDPGGLAGDPKGCISAGQGAVNRPLETSFLESFRNEETSSSETACADVSAGADRDPWLKTEEEETAAPETRPGPPPSAPAPSKEAVQVVGAITAMKVSGRAAMEAASHVERALSLGHAPDAVQGRLARANWSAVRQPVQFVASQVDLYFGEPPVVRRVVRLDASRCPECSETNGLLEDAAGNFIMRCDHAYMAACPECEGGCVRADGRSCGHERSPVSRWNRELACR